MYRERRSARRRALISATINMFAITSMTRTGRSTKRQHLKSANRLNNYVPRPLPKTTAARYSRIRNASVGRFAHPTSNFRLLRGLGRRQSSDGFGGVPGKVESKPPRHLRSFLGQIVNSTFTTQGESAGAQAWSSFDTYCAPFIRYDRLDYKTVRQALQEFIFNLNVPTRVGFQCPFSNLTFDIVVPRTLRDQNVIVGGQVMPETYGEFQEEMDLFNTAFCDVMMEGDRKGRVFTFPIPTINITRDFDWDSPVTEKFMEITCRYGIPYFSNYINSDLSPEDALSMCCRLRLDTSELRKRGGGLFGSNPLTGSIGVVTINLPRLAYISRSESEFRTRLWQQMNIAKNSLEIKRKVIGADGKGAVSLLSNYLKDVKNKTGFFWYNHFNTIGLVGMNRPARTFWGATPTAHHGRGTGFRGADLAVYARR